MPNEEQGAVYDMTEFQDPTDPDAGEVDAVEEQPDTEPQEVVEPVDEADEPVEPNEESLESETVDVPEGKKSRDSAFAEMRRGREAAEAEVANLRAQIEELQGRYQEVETQARQDEFLRAGREMGYSDEEIMQAWADEEESAQREAEMGRLAEENERLNQELINFKVEQAMKQDLLDIQAIDPSVKKLQDLGDDFFKFRAAMDGVDAYFAVKAKQEKTAYGSAPIMGKANAAPVQRDYYTSEELDALTPDEIMANMDKVNLSLERL